MTPATCGLRSCRHSPIARTVPELPTTFSQPRCRNAVCIGSISARAASRARSQRLDESRSSSKKRSLSDTQPRLRLASSCGS